MTALPRRAWAGHAPRAVVRRAPSTRSAAPSSTGPATRARSAGSREPSPSMKQTTPSAGADATRPAQQADPNPRTGSVTTVAPPSAAMRPDPSEDPLSTTMGRYPGGNAARSAGRAAASLRTGTTTSGTPSRSTRRSLTPPSQGAHDSVNSGGGPGPGTSGLAIMGAVLDAPAVVARVLVIEDDPNVAEVVTRYLEREGYDVETVPDGAEGLHRALANPPDLVVLDLMLPSMNGLEVCRRLRAAAPVPVIMLTARGEEADRIAGLELGADDYMSKPFSPRELTARVKAVLRRAATPLATSDQPVLRAGALEVDLVAHEVRRDGELVSLTAKEFDLLVHFMRNPRRAFRREQLLEEVWGFSYGDTSTVTVHVRRLREKIEPDPSAPRHVTTVWGVGYRFEP